jgi:hypothetical protein
MPNYSPDLIQIMRVALDEVMTQIPVEPSDARTQSAHGRGHFDGCRRGPDQLRRVVGFSVGPNSDNPLNADVSSKNACDETQLAAPKPTRSRRHWIIRFTNKIVVITGGRAGLLRVA